MDVTYTPQRLPEFSGNPMIEALPAKVGDKDVLHKLTNRPKIDDEIRTYPDFEREDFLIRLKALREPLFDYLDCFRMIERAIKIGYTSRNPFNATTMQYLHHIDYDSIPIKPLSGGFQSEGSAMTLIGESGIGKSKMIEQILPCFPQTRFHKIYDGHKFVFEQVVWLKVTCPSNGSLSILCRSILKELDRAIGRPLTKHEYFEESLLEQVEMHLRNSFVGILVIDEVQELSLASDYDVKQFLAFTFHLINRSGIPILFCGNPKVSEILQQTFRTARRAESAGYIHMKRMNTLMWDIFIVRLWKLQATDVVTPLSAPLSDNSIDYASCIMI